MSPSYFDGNLASPTTLSMILFIITMRVTCGLEFRSDLISTRDLMGKWNCCCEWFCGFHLNWNMNRKITESRASLKLNIELPWTYGPVSYCVLGAQYVPFNIARVWYVHYNGINNNTVWMEDGEPLQRMCVSDDATLPIHSMYPRARDEDHFV